MSRNLLRALLATVLLYASSFLAGPAPAGAQSYDTLCPAMTDSLTRLYTAFLDRRPDASGFRYWKQAYETGALSLAEIAQEFATADEFAHRFVNNQQFVNWLYDDVLGPDLATDRQQWWVQALDRGYPRGSVALAFTESREYVRKTSTVVPLAGFLRWYPKGTRWHCNVGSARVVTGPLAGELWADYFFHNRSERTDQIELWTVEADGQRNIPMNRGELGAGRTDYNWDGQFTGDGDYGDKIEVRAGAETEWTVVFYPRSIGPERLGWQLG